jgi:hypothetical protein
MTTTLVPAANGHRAPNGRFLPGNPGGPGNPFVKQVAALKGALYESLTPHDIRAIMQKMRDRALAGDVAAARLVLEYTLGRPVQGSTASALDAEITQRLNYDALTDDELKTLIRLQDKAQVLPGNAD